MDLLQAIQAKTPPTSDILNVWGRKRSPKFVRYFEILFLATVQSNALLFAYGGKFKLKKNQPTRSHFDLILHSDWLGIRSVPPRKFLSVLRIVGK